MAEVTLSATGVFQHSFPIPTPSSLDQHFLAKLLSNLRPEGMQKLKVAANSGQNPGFEYLHECWNDDPALVIVINKLLVKFPQWGLVAADGGLVKWEE